MLIGDFISKILFFLEFVSKAWHTCKARLMSARPLSRVELKLWVRGVTVFKLGSGTISWCSKRQPTVSLSTTEAEYRAAAMAAQESTWLIQLMNNLHQLVDYAVPLYCDNQSAIRLMENPVFHARTKHVEVHYHFIKEKVNDGLVALNWVSTQEQIADIFTKNLGGAPFEKFRDKLLSRC